VLVDAGVEGVAKPDGAPFPVAATVGCVESESEGAWVIDGVALSDPEPVQPASIKPRHSMIGDHL